MFEEPSFLVQLGWQGKKRVKFGIDEDYIDGAILSPSDYIESSLKEIAENLKSSSKYVLFDPQFYLPDQGDRDKLNRYDYHDNFGGDDFDNGVFFNSSDRTDFFEHLIDLQDSLSCDAYISPASHLSSLSNSEVDDWKQLTEHFVNKTKSYGRDLPVFATLAVSGKHLTDDSLRNYLLNMATSLDVDGFYISVEYSDTDVALPLQGKNNIRSYIDLLLSLKVNRYQVIAANTHQIAHVFLPIGVDAFASGHFNNLKSFDTNRWVVPDDPPPRQRVTRYYSDELLAEVRPDHLLTELAENTSVEISKVQSNPTSPWEDDLFDSGSINAGWPDSEGGWDHYMYSCGKIAQKYRGLSKGERVSHAKEKIRKAKALHRKVGKEINEYTDELDEQFLEDWEEVLEEIESTPEFKRL